MSATPPAVADALLSVSKALPNGAANVVSDPIDLGNGPRGDFVAPGELLLSAPAVTTGELANAATITYDLEQSLDNSSWAVLEAGVLVQTGAGGAGAVAASRRFKPPTTVSRYVRFKATNSGAGNISGKSATMGWVI